jgi:hypothetical protein
MDLSKEHLVNEVDCSECRALGGHTDTCVKFQQHFFSLIREEGKRITQVRLETRKEEDGTPSAYPTNQGSVPAR